MGLPIISEEQKRRIHNTGMEILEKGKFREIERIYQEGEKILL